MAPRVPSGAQGASSTAPPGASAETDVEAVLNERVRGWLRARGGQAPVAQNGMHELARAVGWSSAQKRVVGPLEKFFGRVFSVAGGILRERE